ncbi:hypothetical protein K504DRAFT_497349 [Pleomassaria siparia CBS 279.74]|uniref:DUF7820 domain-containing protein n=1 Tax=Pleomassaria siparia CBS 279.74 TaxID=1314801 RepID=A0A6G1KSE8_9PLEO|nr:hypothetical protein K504DRAFT_497349 [Pleomassaria siparia CBS 279.74]
MRLPRSSSRATTTQALPSIQTLFRSSPTLNGSPCTGTPVSPPKVSDKEVEDGIELVPIERLKREDTSKICTPSSDEKEFVSRSQLDLEFGSKPLPRVPKKWIRLSIKWRIVAIICLQLLFLLTIVLSLMATKKESTDKTEQESATVQSASPVQPSPTPRYLPIQRGTFALKLGSPQQAMSGCLSQSNESAAWQCATHPSLQVTLLPPPVDQNNLAILSLGSDSDVKPSEYGIQDLKIEPLELKPTTDEERKDNGLAYYFNTTYTRIVLLKESQIVAQGQPPTPLDTSMSKIEIDERPWMCVFEDTLLEGYIYVTQPSALNNSGVEFAAANGSGAVMISSLPYVTKIIEQKMLTDTIPYCKQMKMESNGTLAPYGDKKMLTLSDTSLMPAKFGEELRVAMTEQRRQQMSSPNACRCQWVIG